MESLYFLVPCALIFIALAIKALFWAINNGQYDNLDTEAHRILFDAEAKPNPTVIPPSTLAISATDTVLDASPTDDSSQQGKK